METLNRKGAKNTAPDRSAGKLNGIFLSNATVVNPYLIAGRLDGSLTDIDGEPVSNANEVEKYKQIRNYIKR